MSSGRETGDATSTQPTKSVESIEMPVHEWATSSTREAAVGSIDGSPIGAALYLTAEELRELGAALDDGCVTFYVVDGQLKVE